MTTLSNTSGSKKVKISNNNGMINAVLVQVYNNQEDVIIRKSSSTEKTASKWAIKTLA